MAAQEQTVVFGGRAYSIVYNSNALFRLEKETGYSIQQIGFLLLNGRGGYALMQQILWAGLEGARIRNITRPNPFTVEEVGDLLDTEGGPAMIWENDKHPVAISIMDAWISAFPKKERKDLPKDTDPNAPAAANPTGTT